MDGRGRVTAGLAAVLLLSACRGGFGALPEPTSTDHLERQAAEELIDTITWLTSSRPEGEIAEPELIITGSDDCGLASALAEAGVFIGVGSSPDGGRVNVRGNGPPSGDALSGWITRPIFDPGFPSRWTWDDSAYSSYGAEADAQDFVDTEMTENSFVGTVEWTDGEGCQASFGVEIVVGENVIDWFETLPPNGPPPCQLEHDYTKLPFENGQGTFEGRLSPNPEAAEPAEDCGGIPLVITMSGSSEGSTTFEVVSSDDGAVVFDYTRPTGGEVSGVILAITMGAYDLDSISEKGE